MDIKHYGQKQLGEERVYFISKLSDHTPSLSKSGQELKARMWRQDLKQRERRGVAYKFTPNGLLCLPTYSIQDHQTRYRITHSELGSLMSIITQKMSTLCP